nr:bulb-type lectin domain-containing protein [Tanacetum cinerariifolium]
MKNYNLRKRLYQRPHVNSVTLRHDWTKGRFSRGRNEQGKLEQNLVWNKATRQLTVNLFEGFIRFMKLANNNKVVLKHREIFRECFESMLKWFHNTYIEGDVTKLMPSTIGGYEICLFDLYKLVKCFGGYERLNYKKKWDEVSLGFGFLGLYRLRTTIGIVEVLFGQAGPDDSLGAVLCLPRPWMVLPTKKNWLEGDPRPEPRDPPFDSQVAPAYMCRVIVLRRLVSRGRRPIEDVLLWSGNANMAFDSRPTEDVLSWSGNANMAFDLRSTEDVLPWLECHERTEDTKKENMSGRAKYRGRIGPMTANTKKENMTEYAERHGRTKPMTTDTKKENMSRRAKYCGRTGPMTANTKKENMSRHAKRHGRTEPMTADSKKENMTGHAECHERTDPMITDTKKENISERAEYRGRTGPMTADTKKENMSEHAKRHGRTEPLTADSKKENMSGRA